MCRGIDGWEDAYRVAQSQGGPNAAKQVAFLWAKTLGGESAVKLLQRFGILEQGIDFACESYQFDFAFELARLAADDKTEEIHMKYAMALEDEGKFREAEAQFIKAKKAKEAVLMYVHNQDWDSAQRVAEEHDPESVSDVLVGQAKVAFDLKDWSKFESLLLRAQRPELAVKQFKDNNMWRDALRVCKEYLPHKLKSLQDEYDRETGGSGSGQDADAIMAQARQWEESGDYERAVDCYMKVDTGGPAVMAKAWSKAADLAVKFLDSDKAIDVAQTVGPMLVQVGRHNAAAQLYMSVEMIKEAIDAFIAAREWAKAKKVASELEPRLESYIDQRYKDFLKNEGKADQLASVDLTSALDMYVEQGNWDKALDTAAEHGNDVLHKYLATHATNLIKDGQATQALQLYRKYGCPTFPQNFNIYKRIAVDLFARNAQEDVKGKMYYVWSGLRDLLFDLTENMTKERANPDALEDFKLLLLISHYLATRSACQTQSGLQELAAKLSVALLRHSDVMPADKAFYEAGIACRESGWLNMAFVLLNRLV